MLRAQVLLSMTLAMAAGCQTSSTSVALQTMRVVTPSYDAETLVVPNTPQHVAVGTSQAFSVNPAAGYTLTSLVGGTCPMGAWGENVYRTGAIAGDCTVIFSSTRQYYDVTASAAHVALAPAAGELSVGSGATQSFTVTPESGYVVSNTVGGTCPMGTWAGVTYTTGPIDANCSIAFSATPVYFLVSPVDGNVSTSPVAAQPVLWGATQAFTVVPDAGFLLSSNVGGTCAAGDWNASVYVTGAINANCTVVFDAYVPTSTVMVTNANVTSVPAVAEIVNRGSTANFSVSPNAGYAVSQVVGGTCPTGSWSGNVYTTGMLDTNCTVSFSGTPFLAVPDAFIHTASLTTTGGNTTFAFTWSAPDDTTTPTNDQNYTLCASPPDPAAGTFSTVAQVLASNHCLLTRGTTSGALTVPTGHAYLFNVVATNAMGTQAAYQPKGEFTDSAQLMYLPFESGVSDLVGGGNLIVASYNATNANAGVPAADRWNNPNRAYALSAAQQSCLETNGLVDPSVTGTQPRTMTFWLRTGINPQMSVPLSIGGGNGNNLTDGDHFGMHNQGVASFWRIWGFDDDPPTTTAYENDGPWTFWAISYSGSTGTSASMYTNGAKVLDQNTWTGNLVVPNTASAPLFVGCGVNGYPGDLGTLDNFFDGAIDDIRVFNRVLCDGTGNNGCAQMTDEITNLYNVSRPAP